MHFIKRANRTFCNRWLWQLRANLVPTKKTTQNVVRTPETFEKQWRLCATPAMVFKGGFISKRDLLCEKAQTF